MTKDIKLGDFLSLTACEVIGLVVKIEPSTFGPDDSVVVTLEIDRGGMETKRFRIENGQFENMRS